MANRAVKFLREYVVNNGTGNQPGPCFKAGATYQLPDDQADFWLRTGHAVMATAEEAADAAPVSGVSADAGGDLESMKSRDLISLADAENIELGDATRKVDIVAKIRAARTAKLAPAAPADQPIVQPTTDPSAPGST